MSFAIREKRTADEPKLAALWTARYGATTVVSRGQLWHPLELSGFVAVEGDELVGAITWRVDAGQLEVVTLDSLFDNRGIGTALLTAVAGVGRELGVRRLWLITSNDNIRAIRFYQRRGWSLAALHRDSITRARETKPEIPILGTDNIPIRDEIEFELLL